MSSEKYRVRFIRGRRRPEPGGLWECGIPDVKGCHRKIVAVYPGLSVLFLSGVQLEAVRLPSLPVNVRLLCCFLLSYATHLLAMPACLILVAFNLSQISYCYNMHRVCQRRVAAHCRSSTESRAGVGRWVVQVCGSVGAWMCITHPAVGLSGSLELALNGAHFRARFLYFRRRDRYRLCDHDVVVRLARH